MGVHDCIQTSKRGRVTLENYLQDYVKWRGALFHHFLLALVDEDADVRGLAEYLLTDSLASKVWDLI